MGYLTQVVSDSLFSFDLDKTVVHVFQKLSAISVWPAQPRFWVCLS